MPNSRPKHRFWRLCRIYFRRFRISIWVVTIVVLSGVLYLNRVGLPDFIKRPLVNKLREQGVALEFAQLRWHWATGLSRTASVSVRWTTGRPAIAGRAKVQIKTQWLAPAGGTAAGGFVGLAGGRLEWIPTNSSTPIRALSVENIRRPVAVVAGRPMAAGRSARRALPGRIFSCPRA